MRNKTLLIIGFGLILLGLCSFLIAAIPKSYSDPDCLLVEVSKHYEWVHRTWFDLNATPMLQHSNIYTPYYAQHFMCKGETEERILMPVHLSAQKKR